jgi:hypothetical protein
LPRLTSFFDSPVASRTPEALDTRDHLRWFFTEGSRAKHRRAALQLVLVSTEQTDTASRRLAWKERLGHQNVLDKNHVVVSAEAFVERVEAARIDRQLVAAAPIEQAHLVPEFLDAAPPRMEVCRRRMSPCTPHRLVGATYASMEARRNRSNAMVVQRPGSHAWTLGPEGVGYCRQYAIGRGFPIHAAHTFHESGLE